MINIELISKIRRLLIENHHEVSEIEMTSGNFDESGNLIEGEIPTITTELCEIGSYDNTCYFTIILLSNSFNEKLFEDIKRYEGLHIYGLENFKKDCFPKEGITFEELKSDLSKEKYAQIQFNFTGLNIDRLLRKYIETKGIFTGIDVFNQLEGSP